jgi:fibronectin type 3 domain-containing protein
MDKTLQRAIKVFGFTAIFIMLFATVVPGGVAPALADTDQPDIESILGPFTKIGPDDGSTQTISVTFSWTVSSAANSYELCYDTTNDHTCSGWKNVGNSTTGTVYIYTPGTYYWQVRAVNSSGNKYADGSSSSYWSFTVQNPAFNKAAPANGSTQDNSSVTFGWTASSSADSYELCYDTSNDSACSAWQNVGFGTSFTVDGLAAGTYYWQVRALIGGAMVYADGSNKSFWAVTVTDSGFAKLAPADGNTESIVVTFSWTPAAAASSYELCYDASNDNACSAWQNVGNVTDVTIGGFSPGTYYWQVRAVIGAAKVYADGSMTSYWSFIVQNPEFTKLDPANGSSQDWSSVTFNWTELPNADYYALCYDTSNDKACSGWQNVGNVTSVTIDGFSAGTYYWQVRGVIGATTLYADVSSKSFWSFTVQNPAFNKLDPVDGSAQDWSSVTFDWTDLPGVDYYELCYDTTNDDACSAWQNVGNVTSVTIDGFSVGTYFWQVRAITGATKIYADAMKKSYWSFIIQGPTFNKLTPVNGSTQEGSVTFSWTESTGASYYELCYDTSNDNACSGTWLNVGNVTSVTRSGFSKATYYWQVRARFGAVSIYADGFTISYWSFTITNPFPAVPANVQATDGAFADKVQITWDPVAGATYYQVYRANSAAGSKSRLGKPVASPFNDSAVTPAVTYYYWVKACNVAGCSDYSAFDTGWRNLAAPTNVQASDGTSGDKVQVTWTAVWGANFYQVYRADTVDGEKTLLGIPAASYSDTTATPTVIYYYWVKACNGVKCGDFSAYNTGWRNFPAPVDVAASDGTFTDEVQITWTAVDWATSYKVYRGGRAGDTKTLLGTADFGQYDDFSARAGVTYFYWVQACDGVICGDFSVYNTGWRNSPVPTAVAASDGVFTNKVQITWVPSAGATSYWVYRATSDFGAKTLLGKPTSSPFGDITTTPGVLYYYWVKACNPSGCSDLSDYDTGFRRFSPPTSVAASDGKYTDKVQITWLGATGATFYEVYRATSLNGEKTLLDLPLASPFNDAAVVPFVTYYYWVTACNDLGCSSFSAYDTGWQKR